LLLLLIFLLRRDVAGALLGWVGGEEAVHRGFLTGLLLVAAAARGRDQEQSGTEESERTWHESLLWLPARRPAQLRPSRSGWSTREAFLVSRDLCGDPFAKDRRPPGNYAQTRAEVQRVARPRQAMSVPALEPAPA